ncbi:MAG: YcgN family cysteine cluster protein [Hyphomicrobiaceae bacterium]
MLDTANGENMSFWEAKTLEELSTAEWEALCDGCGRCCLNKLEDEDNGDIHLTRLSCRLLDLGSCQCMNYEQRQDLVPECVKIDAAVVRNVRWLPVTCAYRVVAEGRPLAWWHPLISGSSETVHEAGISVRGLARSEQGIKIDDYWKFIIEDFEA